MTGGDASPFTVVDHKKTERKMTTLSSGDLGGPRGVKGSYVYQNWHEQPRDHNCGKATPQMGKKLERTGHGEEAGGREALRRSRKSVKT